MKDKTFLKIMENTAKTFGLDETDIYSYRKFNKLLKKELKNRLKQEQPTHTKKNKMSEIDLYKKLNTKNYKELSKLALIYPKELVQAIYLYTICEA